MGELVNAVEYKDFDAVKALIAKGVNINEIDKFGYSALHAASYKRKDEVAIWLIQQGIDVNMQDEKGLSILHYVAVYEQLELAKVALEYGADLTLEDEYGNQPLWRAVHADGGWGKGMEMIKLYLEHGANPDHKNKKGGTPRGMVVERGYEKLLELF